MNGISTRTVKMTIEVSLAPGGREMRRARLKSLMSRQVSDYVEAMGRNGYTVDKILKAEYESDRSDGRGHLWGEIPTGE